MDGRQRKLNSSLQRDLNRWILSVTLVFALLAGTVSGWIAFYQAQELQDTQLRQVAALVAARTADIVLPDDIDPDDALIVQRLGDSGSHKNLPIPADLPDGLHTLDLQGIGWRVFIYTEERPADFPGGHFAVSQKTEARDEVAWGASLRTLLPVLLFAPVLIAVASFAVNQSLKPLRALASTVDRRDENRLDALPDRRVPQEILPFFTSLNRMLERLRQAIAQQQRFVADAAHELRTPVTAVSLLAENAANATTLEEVQVRLEPAQEGLDRMRALVNQLLNLARLQGETQTSLLAPVDFQQLVQQAIGELYPLAEAKSIDLGVLRSEPLTIRGAAGDIGVMVRNAIENAIRYSPTGGKVDVSLFAANGQAVFQVEDRGDGIPEAEIQQVFEPFYRAAGSVESGSGLGLAISQEIAKSLGGEIHLENRAGGGLRFQCSVQTD